MTKRLAALTVVLGVGLAALATAAAPPLPIPSVGAAPFTYAGAPAMPNPQCATICDAFAIAF